MQVHLLLRKVDLGDNVEAVFHNLDDAYDARERANTLYREHMISDLLKLSHYTRESAERYVNGCSDVFYVDTFEVY